MKNQTIYTIICGLMMSSALFASNDDPVTPNAKATISRHVESLPYSPFSKKLVEDDLIAAEAQKRQDKDLQMKAQQAQQALTKTAEEERAKAAAQHKTEMESLQKQLEALSVSKTANETELLSLRKDLVALQEENGKLQTDKKKLEDEQITINEAIRLKTDEITKLSDELIAAQTAATQDNKKIDELLESLKNRKTVMETLSKSLKETRAKYEAKSKELSEKTIEAVQLEQKLKTSEETLKRTEEKLTLVQGHVFNKSGSASSTLVPAGSNAAGTNSAAKQPAASNKKNITAIGDDD